MVWSDARLSPDTPTPVAYEDRVYVLKDSVLSCADLKTGKIAWRLRLDCKGAYASPLAGNGHLYLVDENGVLQTVRLEGDEGRGRQPPGIGRSDHGHAGPRRRSSSTFAATSICGSSRMRTDPYVAYCATFITNASNTSAQSDAAPQITSCVPQHREMRQRRRRALREDASGAKTPGTRS